MNICPSLNDLPRPLATRMHSYYNTVPFVTLTKMRIAQRASKPARPGQFSSMTSSAGPPMRTSYVESLISFVYLFFKGVHW